MLHLAATGTPVDDPLELLMSDEREAEGRPWVMLNMVASIDGGTAVSGKSSELGDHDDLALFTAIRAVPDVVLVGAGTVQAEDYRPLVLDEKRRAARVERGLTATPTLAVVSGRLSVDPEARLFGDPEHKPLLLTSTTADPSKLVLLGDSADISFLPDLSPQTILAQLGAAGVVLLEGGPSLNGQFASSGLIDEVNLSISPVLLSGDSARIAHGPHALAPHQMRLDRVLFGDRMVFVRYLRDT